MFAGLGLFFFSTVGFWLGSTGVVSFSVKPPAGTPTSGNYADITPLSATVSSGNGGATLQTGVALAKITLSDSLLTSTRVDVSWTDVSAAGKVLSNPNAQMMVGIYHAVHEGTCTTNTPGGTDPPFVDIVDGSGTTLCLALDTTATGQPVSSGELMLAHNQVSGYLLPSLAVPSSIPSCATGASEEATSWCQPASVASPAQALWVIASITLPGNGNSPSGQQSLLTGLTFYIGARAS